MLNLGANLGHGFLDLAHRFVQRAAFTVFFVGTAPGCNLPDDVASCILFAPACIGADYVLSIGEGHLLHHRKARRLGAGDFAKSESLSQVFPNLLKRQFDVVDPNKVWVTDITYIRTYEGWLYLAMVLDLFYRQVVGWSMKPQMTRDLAIDALLMAVWSADF